LPSSAPWPKRARISLVMSEQEVDLESSVHGRVGSVVVGKYRLDRVLGIGGMAAVYAATHRNQAEFAVKMLHSELSQSEDVRSRFLREGYIANSVKHPGAVRVVDDDVAEDGSAFLVMELLQGLSVEDLWFRAERQMPIRPVLAMADQLLDVLAAAHAKTIVHRDIKPANLFVTSAGDLKVLDFGIARLRDAATLHATTLAGTMLGTPAFMSPEQALGRSKEIDGQTDVWAVGATLFSLLSGHIVHEADTAPQLLLRAASSHARPLASVAPEVPGPIAAVIDKALAFDKGSRWQGAEAMRDALRDACATAFPQPPTREVLAAYVQEAEASPAPVSGDEPPRPTPVEPETESLTKTKVEAPPPRTLQGTLPLAGRPGPVPAPAPAPPASTGLTTSKPVSSPAPVTPAPSGAPRRSIVPIVIGVALVIGLGVGVAVMLAGRGHASTNAAAPPPALTTLPSASASASDTATPPP
jgi:serine/threonine protein kinase